MSRRQIAQLVLGIALAAVFLSLVVKRLDSDEVLDAFAQARWPWLLAAISSFGIGYTCRIERWRLMLNLGGTRSLPWRDCAGPFMGCFAANNVLPFRAGDVLRAFAFNKQLGTSSGVVLATLFVERLLDLLMVMALLGGFLWSRGMDMDGYASMTVPALALGTITVLSVLFFPGAFIPLAEKFGTILTNLSPRLGKPIQVELTRSLSTLTRLSQGRSMISLVVWSCLAWAAEGGVFWFSALALPSLTQPSAAWLALPIGTLSTLIPSTPGYVGTFDYFTIHAMTSLTNTHSAATAYAFLVHAMIWLPPTLIGGGYFLAKTIRTHTHQ